MARFGTHYLLNNHRVNLRIPKWRVSIINPARGIYCTSSWYILHISDSRTILRNSETGVRIISSKNGCVNGSIKSLSMPNTMKSYYT